MVGFTRQHFGRDVPVHQVPLVAVLPWIARPRLQELKDKVLQVVFPSQELGLAALAVTTSLPPVVVDPAALALEPLTLLEL
jgi:hypothetical protein